MNRMERARKQMRADGLSALLFTSRENKFYLAGLYSGSGYILLTEKDIYAIVDGRYYLAQKKRMTEGTVLLIDADCTAAGHIRRILQEEAIGRIGFEKDEVTVGVWEKWQRDIPAEWVPLSLPHLRSVKTCEELSCIRRACRIADQGYEHILGWIQAGMTEKQVENELLHYMKSLGAHRLISLSPAGRTGRCPMPKPERESSVREILSRWILVRGWENIVPISHAVLRWERPENLWQPCTGLC